MTESLPFLTRLWFAWVCWFRVLLDGAYAAQVFALRPEDSVRKRLSATDEELDEEAALPPARSSPPAEQPRHSEDNSALLLLGVLQREGRLVDFLQQDIKAFSDAEVGSVARVVHDGCRRALDSHMSIVPIRTESEASQVSLPAGFDASSTKLVGNVKGQGPYRGFLRHRGWRADKMDLPRRVSHKGVEVLAPAEVEL